MMMAVFSIGMTTMVLKVAHAQEQKFTALLGGNQEVPPNTSTAKGSHRLSQWVILFGIRLTLMG